ncbi:hypothetical protein NUH30_13720 [Leptospira sp. 85282-16]|nr:hypothetical protein [Leptospira sp. 85282-16]MCT8334738.1 hypothetical protein [Leptospira sp. 85282-16]
MKQSKNTKSWMYVFPAFQMTLADEKTAKPLPVSASNHIPLLNSPLKL